MEDFDFTPVENPPVLRFDIERGFGRVWLRYTQEITRERQRALFDALTDELIVVTGVEKVEMRRYSAVLHVATHVATEEDVIETLYALVFADDYYLNDLICETYGEYEVWADTHESENH